MTRYPPEVPGEPQVEAPVTPTLDAAERRTSSRAIVHDDDRSLGEIMGDLSSDLSTLMRQEVALAKAELSESGKKAGRGAGMLGGAGVAGNLALTFLSLALWWALAIWIGGLDGPALGWSGLIVGALWGIIAAILAARGKSELKDIDGLSQTSETVKQIPDALKGNEEENR